MDFNESVILEWEQKTGIKISDFLFQYYEFFTNSYPVFLQYYTGDLVEVNPIHKQKLDDLLRQYSDIETRIILKSKGSVFQNLLFSEIIERLSDFQIELLSVTKLNKFLRSNLGNFAYSKTYEFQSPLKQQTIEQFAVDNLGGTAEDWVKIAQANDLSEIEYTPADGQNLLVSIKLNSNLFNIQSVIDTISGDSILGKDFDKKITWEQNDLKILDYNNTFSQSIGILLKLQQGDIPEFPILGRSLMPGSSMKLFAFAVIFRQLSQLLSTDDSISRFNVSKINVDNGDIFFEVEIYSSTSSTTQQVFI